MLIAAWQGGRPIPIIQLELDSKGAISSLQKFDRAVDATSTSATSKFGAIAKKAGLMAAAVGAAVGAAALVIAKQSLDAAARMEEATNKYNVVFEGMTAASDQWVAELRKNYGLSKLAATDYLSSTKAIIDGTMMQTEAAGELSNQVVLLAQDLASFHDKSPEQAVRAMTSALTGEYEAMKQFGVVIKKTEVIQEAMRMNNLKTKESVTQAMEAQAAYSLVLQKSGKAQGDTIRSQESYTFQLKKTKALLDDVRVAIGEQLLPIATRFLKMLNSWGTEQDGVTKAMEFTVNILVGTIETLRFLENGIRGVILVARGIGVVFAGAFVLAAKGIRLALTPLDLLLRGAKALGFIKTNPLQALTEYSYDFFQSQVEGFKETYKGIEGANTRWDTARNVVEKTAEAHSLAKAAAKKAALESTAAAASTEASGGAWKAQVDKVAISYDKVAISAKAAAAAATQAASASGATPSVSVASGGKESTWNGDTWVDNKGVDIRDAGTSGLTINNNFTQSLAKSDITDITTQQAREAGRV